ncbi:MAG: lysophospholipid acyltransferase family protein [Candidatus Brocadiia bacterium]
MSEPQNQKEKDRREGGRGGEDRCGLLSAFCDAAVRFGVRAGGEYLSRLPWPALRGIARCLAGIWWVMGVGGRRGRGIKNILKAFPHMSYGAARRLMRRSCEGVLVSSAAALWLRQKVVEGDWRGRVDTSGMEKLEEISDDTGMIFVTAHFGCWEGMGMLLPLCGFPVTSVARPVPHPEVDAYLRQLRETSGQRVIDKRGALIELLRKLREGLNVAFLIDQDARRDGIFVNFMGRPCSTHTSIARLAIKTSSPLAFIHCRAVGSPPTFKVQVSDVLWPREDAPEAEEILRLTQRLTDDVEALVKESPDEWLWTQKRWKTYPGKFTSNNRPMPGVLGEEGRG